MRIFIAVFTLLLMTPPFFASEPDAQPPELLLANTYSKHIDLSDYWISEKLDGVRAYWNGKALVSRQGNTYSAPDWFTSVLPKTELDGELWMGRGNFDELSGIVRRQSGSDSSWANIRYMLFDLPASKDNFNQRLQQLKRIVREIDQSHVQLVEQFRVPSHAALLQRLDNIVAAGGEGLMLHRGSSLYHGTRSDALLKFKKYQDAEAVVIARLPGKGKYQGMMGSLEVESEHHGRFKIGTGFSDQLRKNPPLPGALITYKYYGLTSRGRPRFASFVRVRNQH